MLFRQCTILVEESEENVKRYLRKWLFEYDVYYVFVDFDVGAKIIVGNSMLQHNLSHAVCNTVFTAPK